MRYLCTFCKKKLLLKQNLTVEKEWSFVLKKHYFAEKKHIEKTPLVCSYCKKPVSSQQLTTLGMFHHMPKKERGAGTKFHEVYKKDARVYHAFSQAEDIDNVILKKILAVSSLKKTLLDVGCGTGKYAGLLSTSFKKVYALDPSETLLAFAKNNNRGKTNIEYLLAKAESLPMLNETIDVVISTWASFSPNEAVSEMKRVLKKGGVIIRIGTTKKDDLTELYSKFDERYIQENNSYFETSGFISEYAEILIRFNTLTEAKNVLSKITGQSKLTITKKDLYHKILIHTYKKASH